MLLDAKADPKQADNEDRNAIYLAAQSGHANVLRMLLNRIKRDQQKDVSRASSTRWPAIRCRGSTTRRHESSS